jgi:hypothetical protein
MVAEEMGNWAELLRETATKFQRWIDQGVKIEIRVNYQPARVALGLEIPQSRSVHVSFRDGSWGPPQEDKVCVANVELICEKLWLNSGRPELPQIYLFHLQGLSIYSQWWVDMLLDSNIFSPRDPDFEICHDYSKWHLAIPDFLVASKEYCLIQAEAAEVNQIHCLETGASTPKKRLDPKKIKAKLRDLGYSHTWPELARLLGNGISVYTVQSWFRSMNHSFPNDATLEHLISLLSEGQSQVVGIEAYLCDDQ